MAMHARLVRSSLDGRSCVRPLRATRATLTLALLATATLTACGDDARSGDFKPNGSLATASTSAAPSPQARPPSTLPTAQIDKTVLDRYREYRKIFKRVYEVNDASELGAVAMDPLLNDVTRDIEETKAKGEIWRFTTVSNARVYARAKDGLTVYVVDCIRTLAGYRFSAKTGKRVGGGPGGAFLHRSAVRYDQGTWKVSDSVRDKKC